MKKFGIANLDKILGGGLDDASLNVLVGKNGVGKTVLASQWIAEGAKKKETCVYISTSMPVTAIEKHLGRMDFMADIFDRINWRVVDIEAKMFMPVTKEKVNEWFERYIGLEAEEIDRLVFDVVSCIMRAVGDLVLFRRILKELDRIFYKGGIAAILVEDMESSWPITVGMSECAIHLDILKTPVGYQRALRIIKRYGVEHTLNWIPFEVTRRGVELKDREYFEMDTSTIQV